MKNDIQHRRIAAGERVEDRDGVMDLGKALEIVLEMAKAAIAQPAIRLPASKHAVSTAMDTVEDFVVNHFEEDDEVQGETRQERLSALFEAMERHGNSEGTETQLGDAGEFLRLAFESLSPTRQTEFLDSQAVTEFMEREGGKEAQSEPIL